MWLVEANNIFFEDERLKSLAKRIVDFHIDSEKSIKLKYLVFINEKDVEMIASEISIKQFEAKINSILIEKQRILQLTTEEYLKELLYKWS